MPNEEPIVLWPGWETVRLIGRGSFGAVYEIRRELLGNTEKAALKLITIPENRSEIEMLLDEGYDDASVKSTFQEYLKGIVDEYSLMRKLNGSANVVNCDDVRYEQHEDGFGWDIFIKMELLTPLTKALGKEIPDSQVIRIGADICKALALCRKHNIVHRDIKPANIFVSDNGDYKLGDFGIAKTVEKTSGGTKIGTYDYMAPEVYRDLPYGSGADLYSLGMVLYWLLNEKRTPFLPLPPSMPTAADKEQARRQRFDGEALPAPAHGSPALQQIVLKACAFDPKDRYQSAEEMLRDLENAEFDAAQPPAASVGTTIGCPPLTDTPPAGAIAESPASQPRKKTWLPVLLGLVAVLAAILVLVLRPRGSEAAPGTTSSAEAAAKAETQAAAEAAEAAAAEAAGLEEGALAPAAAFTEAETAGKLDTDIRVAMITDYGDITDQSFNQATYEACKEYCEGAGLTFKYFITRSDSAADRFDGIENAIDEGFNVVVMPGYAFAPAIAATAPQYPDVLFIALDVPEDELLFAGLETLPSNLYSAVYQVELGGFMAGYAAVKLGYKNLGFLGGMAVSDVIRYGCGFVQGADAAAAELGLTDVTINYAYANQFYGDDEITADMISWYASGTEVVFACGGGIYTSAAEAASMFGGKVIGIDVDQAPTIDSLYGEGITLTSAMKGLAPTVKTMLHAVQTGAFQGGRVETLGLVSENPEENYVQLPLRSTQFSDSFTAEDYAALVRAMLRGEYLVLDDIWISSVSALAEVVTVNDLGSLK